jgi:hypothetical protein
MKEVRGCLKPTERPIRLPKTQITLNECPRKSVDYEIKNALVAFHYFKGFQFPNAGTWQDQPNKYFDVMGLIQEAFDTFREDEKQ